MFNLRVRIPGNKLWTTFDLVAIQDYSNIEINLLRPLQGSSIPASKQVLLEKKALENLNVPIGSELEFQLANGTLKKMTVAGIVQDQTSGAGDFLAPPLAFISMDTLKYLARVVSPGGYTADDAVIKHAKSQSYSFSGRKQVVVGED